MQLELKKNCLNGYHDYKTPAKEVLLLSLVANESLSLKLFYQGDDLTGLVDDSGVEEGGDALPEGIYNVPRSMFLGDGPIGDHDSIIPIAGGIYDVPRSLLENGTPIHGSELHMTGNPFDIYDVPRTNQSPDDDAIYDYPLDFDLGDMEIYDYPPDAALLGN